MSQDSTKQNSTGNTPAPASSSTPPDIQNEKPTFAEYQNNKKAVALKKRAEFKSQLPYKSFAAIGGFIGIGTWLTYSFMFKVINRGKGRGVILPYMPATPVQIQNVFAALRYKHITPIKSLEPKYTNCMDIGSGNGEICINVAKELKYQHTLGIEINRPLVLWSRLRALRAGLARRQITFKTKDLWKYNISHLDNVVIFGVEQMMPQLDKKFHEELKEDTRIVVCRFPLMDRTPVATFGEGVDQVWLYFQDKDEEKSEYKYNVPDSF